MKTKTGCKSTVAVQIDCKQAKKELRLIHKKIIDLKKELNGLSELISKSFNVNVKTIHHFNEVGIVSDRAKI